jgi:hypothetical protein
MRITDASGEDAGVDRGDDLIAVVIVFVLIRVIEDSASLSSGVLPPEGDFGRRYAERPILAYLHILPGVVYLLGAPFQLSERIRRRRVGFSSEAGPGCDHLRAGHRGLRHRRWLGHALWQVGGGDWCSAS